MFLHVGSGTNESTMSNSSTRIKSLHILGDFSKLRVVEFEDASTSFHGRKSRFGSSDLIHGTSQRPKKTSHGSREHQRVLWHSVKGGQLQHQHSGHRTGRTTTNSTSSSSLSSVSRADKSAEKMEKSCDQSTAEASSPGHTASAC